MIKKTSGKRELHSRHWPLLAAFLAGFCVTTAMADEAVEAGPRTESHSQEIEAWREARDKRLRQPDGWLTLVGLEWLKEGETRIGHSSENDIRLGAGPDFWGTVVLQDGEVVFNNADPTAVRINEEALPRAVLVPDTEGQPTVISAATLNITLIFRESFALRIKDSEARALQNFKGVENYPTDEAWRIDGRFIPADESAGIEITNVLGQVSETPVLGTFEFDMNGKTYSLIGLGDADSANVWFIFADRTSGHGTYGAGRYLYSEGLPKNGRLTVDFNKAYNPPCAFNPYSTCPIPPQRNRMDLQVLAGERDYQPESG